MRAGIAESRRCSSASVGAGKAAILSLAASARRPLLLPRDLRQGRLAANMLRLREGPATMAKVRRMTGYVALLRAVNVGGTGKLPMTVLAEMCGAAGFGQVRTYIASGNAVFQSDGIEDQVRSALEDRLRAYAGKKVGVVVRSASEIADVLVRNPFAESPGNRVAALFVDGSLPNDPLDGVTGAKSEQIRLGKRELFVFYPDGMATTRLRIPSGKHGTARNMNTVAKLAEMMAGLA